MPKKTIKETVKKAKKTVKKAVKKTKKNPIEFITKDSGKVVKMVHGKAQRIFRDEAEAKTDKEYNQ